jgi:hypothetical protein
MFSTEPKLGDSHGAVAKHQPVPYIDDGDSSMGTTSIK